MLNFITNQAREIILNCHEAFAEDFSGLNSWILFRQDELDSPILNTTKKIKILAIS